MCSKWIQDYAKNEDIISLEQKVIEVLAIYPGLSLKQIVNNTGETREEKIIKVLDSYIMKEFHYKDNYDINSDDDNGDSLEQYLDFMHHCIVAIRLTAKGTETYELSLFGIIIAMTLIRYHEMGRRRISLFYHGLSRNHLSFTYIHQSFVRA